MFCGLSGQRKASASLRLINLTNERSETSYGALTRLAGLALFLMGSWGRCPLCFTCFAGWEQLRSDHPVGSGFMLRLLGSWQLWQADAECYTAA
jgi:hypothetical protein